VEDALHQEQRSAEDITGPKVFLSYRRADTRDVAKGLSAWLRDDLGSSNVFRDEEDLIGGQPWQQVLADSISGSDAVVILIGRDWTGQRPDGTRRIDDTTDVVRDEVVQALRDPRRSLAVPVLIDIARPPTDLPPDVQPLFDRHAMKATRENLRRRASVDYQAVLVSIWECLRRQVPRGVLVVGGGHALASVDGLVDELQKARAIDARKLSRFAAGAVIVSARRARRGARRWPDAIVLVEREDDETVTARIQALYEHPSVRGVALVGAGAAAGVAGSQLAGLASGSTGSGTAVTTQPMSELVASLPHAGSGATGALTSGWANAAVGTKVAIAAGTVAVAATAGVGVSAVIGGDGSEPVEFAEATTVRASNDTEDDERLYPLGLPEDAVVTLGPPAPTGTSVGPTIESVSREVSVELGEADEPIDLGSVILPTSLSNPDLAGGTDGLTTIATVGQDMELPIAGMPASDYCYSGDDPWTVLAGWIFTGGPTTLTVTFSVVTKAGELTGTQISVQLDGPARRRSLPDTPRGHQFTDQCPVDRDARALLVSS
jgi:TIR domain